MESVEFRMKIASFLHFTLHTINGKIMLIVCTFKEW